MAESYALCINCEEIIESRDAESHSLQCQDVQSEVVTANGLRTYCSVQKMIVFLEKELRHRNWRWPNGAKLLKLAQDTLNTDSLESAEELQTTLDLSQTLFSDSEALEVMIFQRLRTSCIDLLQRFHPRASAAPRNSFVHIDSEIERYKRKVERLQSLLSPRYSGTKDAPKDSESTVSYTEEDILEDERAFSTVIDGNESLKQYFYTQCVALSLKTRRGKKGKKLPIEELYRRVVDENIPIEAWPNFIRRHINQPQTWTQRYMSTSLVIPEESVDSA